MRSEGESRRRFPCGRPVHLVSMRRRRVILMLHVHRRRFTRQRGRHRALQRNRSSRECRSDETTNGGHMGEVMHEIAGRLRGRLVVHHNVSSINRR